MNPGLWSRKWLLWLALLLPVAQAFAATHALSHATGERQGESLAHRVHCDLCLTAADLGTGVPTADVVVPVPVMTAHVAPLVVRGGAPRAVSLGLPPARAPPASR